jgi:hypothetical protein
MKIETPLTMPQDAKRVSWHALATNTDPGDNLKILCGDLIEIGGVGNVGEAGHYLGH